MFADGMAAVLPHAARQKFRSRSRRCIRCMRRIAAASRCSPKRSTCATQLGDGVGVAVDVYHLWWDPNLAAQIKRAGARILAHHICDWLVPTKDLLLDRGMMGDGVIDLPGIRRMVEAAGFHGHQEVEIFSAENWWKRPGDEVLRTCVERYNTVC